MTDERIAIVIHTHSTSQPYGLSMIESSQATTGTPGKAVLVTYRQTLLLFSSTIILQARVQDITFNKTTCLL